MGPWPFRILKRASPQLFVRLFQQHLPRKHRHVLLPTSMSLMFAHRSVPSKGQTPAGQVFHWLCSLTVSGTYTRAGHKGGTNQVQRECLAPQTNDGCALCHPLCQAYTEGKGTAKCLSLPTCSKVTPTSHLTTLSSPAQSRHPKPPMPLGVPGSHCYQRLLCPPAGLDHTLGKHHIQRAHQPPRHCWWQLPELRPPSPGLCRGCPGAGTGSDHSKQL